MILWDYEASRYSVKRPKAGCLVGLQWLEDAHHMDPSVHKRKASVALLSVVSNTILVILKLVVGVAIQSVSVISESIHSGVDLLAAVIAFIAVRVSGKPADKDHPFGHGKAENISGTVEAILIFLAAAWIVFEAYRKLKSGEPVEAPMWGVIVMFVSAVANIIVSSRLFKIGNETESAALLADAWHLRTDVWTSVGVMFGLALIWIGEMVFPGYHFHWIDPVAAMLVAMLIVRAAYHLTVQSSRDLMDVSLPEEEENWIRDYIASVRPTVRSFHQLRTRKAGANRFIEFHLLVDAAMSVDESHRITDIMSNEIRQHFPNSSVTIHIEPCKGDCTPPCEEACLLNEKEREQVSREATLASQSSPADLE